MYCKNCGKQIDDDSKFCRFCGTALDANFNKETSRKTVYEGEIHKCPNCGQTLNSFTAYCPACGYEIQKNNIGKSPIIYFTDTLRSCFTTDEMEKFIDTFVVPSTNKDIVDFSNFIESAITPESKLNDSYFRMMGRILNSAKLLYKDRPDQYADFERKFNCIKKKYEQSKKAAFKNSKKEKSKIKWERRETALKSVPRSFSQFLKMVATNHPLLVINLILLALSISFIVLGSLYFDGYSWLMWTGIGLFVLFLCFNLFVWEHYFTCFFIILLTICTVLLVFGILFISTLWYLILISIALLPIGTIVCVVLSDSDF